jgi:hypothetical protein
MVSIGAIEMVVGVVNTLAGIPTQLAKGFATAVTWLQGAFDETVNFIAKKLLYIYSLIDRSVDYEKAAMQMDTEANKRADNRQQSLDDANAKRNEDLQRANQGRLGVANEMNRGIQSQADATKQGRDDRNKELLTGFDSQIEQLRKDLADQTKSIQQTADEQAKTAETSKFAQEKPAPERPKIPTVEQVKSTTATQTAGTFSGFAAGMIGGTTSALDRMADQSAKSNELLTQIAKNTAQSPSPTYGT